MIGVVCGFQAEVDCFWRAVERAGLEKSAFKVLMSASSAERGQAAAEQLVNEGCKTLLSFGIAGGLSPKLRVGDVVFSNHVVTTLDESYGQRIPPKKVTTLSLGSAKPHLLSVCGVDTIVFNPTEKAQLHHITNAGIADMESHGVARAATAAERPFFVLRAVSDAANDTLPTFVAHAVKEDGTPGLRPILLVLLANPFRLGALLRLKSNTDRALKSLETMAVSTLPKLL